jgi:enoyl-[acyl-carrier-protein] reductase (NADH)
MNFGRPGATRHFFRASCRRGPLAEAPTGPSGRAHQAPRALAVELAPIRVNAVCPGVVRSPLWASMTKASREQLYRDTAAAIPAGRVGEAGDIAHAYLYCLTEPFATGSILTVDGGTVLA